MRSKTAIVTAVLLAAALAARVVTPAADLEEQQTTLAVGQLRDPAAADRLNRLRQRQWWADTGSLAACAALAVVAVAAEAAARLTTPGHPNAP